MIGWIRFFMILLAMLGVLYAALWFQRRRRMKDDLLAEYAKKSAGETLGQSRDDFVDERLAQYSQKLKTRLLAGVFLIPVVIAGFLLYLAIHA